MNSPFPASAIHTLVVFVGWEERVRLRRYHPRRAVGREMSLPVRIMVAKAGQPPWTMEARQNERPQWRPDDAAGAAGRDTRAGHGAESRRDPGRRAEGPGGRPRRTGRGAAGDPRRGERVPRAL